MPAWALPLITSLLSAGGTIYNNSQNRKQAANQMNFQERMSNTAAGRSVHDYRSAGLNPALAYDRSASSPGGAAAQLADAVGMGVSNAMNAKRLKADLDTAYESQRKLRSETSLNEVETANRKITGAQAAQNLLFQGQNQPHNLRALIAEALLSELQIPGAKNTADYERMLGMAGRGMATAKTASEIIKMFMGSRMKITKTHRGLGWD